MPRHRNKQNDGVDDEIIVGKPLVDEESVDDDDTMSTSTEYQEIVDLVDDLLSPVLERIQIVEERQAATDKMVDNIRKVVVEQNKLLAANQLDTSKLLKGSDTKPTGAEVQEPRGIVDSTLGSVGSILHGVVDTCAFVLETSIDLVTLGRAKRD